MPHTVLLLLLLLPVLSPLGAGPPHRDVDRVERTVPAMGTWLGVGVDAGDRATALDLSARAVEEVERWEARLSTWRPDTPVSRLNRRTPGLPMGVEDGLPAEVVEVLGQAFDWSRRTGGAFDPAVGPLIDAWGLRSGGRAPDAGELAAARAASGASAFTWRPGRIEMTRSHPAAWLDTGGFGKGAALDGAAAALREGGATAAVLDLGGQVLVVGAGSTGADAWPLDVAHPSDRGRPVARLLLRDASAATSGTSERGGHILDPRTGRPVAGWGSVTVVAPDAFLADVLSTALFVMGPEEGLAFAESLPHVGALFLVHDGSGGFDTLHDSTMSRWLSEAADSSYTGPHR